MTKFEKFLINRGLLEKFKTNYLSTPRTMSFTEFLFYYGKSKGALNSGFGWVNTPEGFRFWFNVDYEWCKSFDNKSL